MRAIEPSSASLRRPRRLGAARPRRPALRGWRLGSRPAGSESFALGGGLAARGASPALVRALGHGCLHRAAPRRSGAAPGSTRRLRLAFGLGIPLRGYSHGTHAFSCRPAKLLGISPIPELLDKRLVFVTGKGGVGKTTVAVALGLRAAAEGQADDRLRGLRAGARLTDLRPHRGRLPRGRDGGEPLGDLDRPRRVDARVRAAPAQGPGDARHALPQPHLQLPRRGHPGLKELVTIGKIWELAQLDRKVKSGRKYDLVIVDAPGDRPRHRLPADASHLRRDRPGRPDPLAGAAARPADHRPRPHRDGDRRAARGDAGQRVGGARARPPRGGRRRGRPRLHERALPGALLERGGGEARRAGRASENGTRSGRRRAPRSPSTAGPARSEPSSPACAAGSRRRSRRCPSSSSRSSGSRRPAGSRGGWADAVASARSSRARTSASAPAPAGSARRPPRRRSRPGWRRAASRSAC